MPYAASVKILGISLSDALLYPVPERPKTLYIAYGDSITPLITMTALVGNSMVISPCYLPSHTYRFWSDTKQGHFYTSSEDEKNHIIATYPESVWRYEGIAYNSYSGAGPGLVPIYRFWSDEKQHHFYTASEDEKNYVIDFYDDFVWKYESIAYYAYTTQQPDTTAVYRFWSDTKQGHFYTSSGDEKNHIIATYPENVWKYEGIAWYVPTN